MRIVKCKIASIAAASLMVCLAGAIAAEAQHAGKNSTSNIENLQTEQESTTAAENSKARHNEIVERVFSAWNSHDPEKVLAYYTDDVVYEDVPLGVINHGKAELRKFVEETLNTFPDLNVQLVGSSIWNNHGVSEVVWGGTDRGYWKTNKRFSVRMLSTFELQGGKFSRNKDFYDLAAIMRQVGVLQTEEANASHITTTDTDEAEIKALYDRWAKAFETRDIEGIMSVYAPGDAVISYDIAPPLQYKGKDAYRKDYQEFLAQYDGPIRVEYRDMRILSSGDVGFLHALERLTGKLKNGQQSDMWLRATSGVRKINGKWLIVHDHISVPTDFESGKAVLDLKP